MTVRRLAFLAVFALLIVGGLRDHLPATAQTAPATAWRMGTPQPFVSDVYRYIPNNVVSYRIERADSIGGSVVVQMTGPAAKRSSALNCSETIEYRFTWTFQGDYSRVVRGQSFSILQNIARLDTNASVCQNAASVYMIMGVNRGSTSDGASQLGVYTDLFQVVGAGGENRFYIPSEWSPRTNGTNPVVIQVYPTQVDSRPGGFIQIGIRAGIDLNIVYPYSAEATAATPAPQPTVSPPSGGTRGTATPDEPYRTGLNGVVWISQGGPASGSDVTSAIRAGAPNCTVRSLFILQSGTWYYYLPEFSISTIISVPAVANTWVIMACSGSAPPPVATAAPARAPTQTLTVRADTLVQQRSNALDPSHRYRITTSGVVAIHDVTLPERDALYCIDPAPLDRNGAPLCLARSRLPILRLNATFDSSGTVVGGQGLDEFAGPILPYSSDHRYVIEVSGKSGVVTFVFGAGPNDLFNKSGSWTIVIEDLGPR